MLYNQNLLKSGWIVVNQEDTVVIDSNKAVEKRLSAVIGSDAVSQEAVAYQPVSFDDITEADGVSRLFDERDDASQEEREGEESSQTRPELVESAVNRSQVLEEARQQAEDILKNAHAQADEIINQAAIQAEADAGKAYDLAYEKGLQEGYQQGMQNSLVESEALKKEYRQKELELNRQYEQRLEEIEPYMVKELTGIYEHIFQVDLSQHRNILLHLIANTLRSIQVSDTYLIHVSEQDYSFVTMQKSQLMEEGCLGNAQIEIVEDRTLSKNECLIETVDGIFDCSLAVELDELKRKLQLLSYTGKKE